MSRIDEIRAREQAVTESLISRLTYCMGGGYTAYDTIRSLCQESMITINRLTARIEALERALKYYAPCSTCNGVADCKTYGKAVACTLTSFKPDAWEFDEARFAGGERE